MSSHTVAAIAERIGGTLVGDGERVIDGIADLRFAGPRQIAFVRNRRFASVAATGRAGALIVGEALAIDVPQIVVANADAAFARTAQLFHPTPRAEQHDIHPAASVDPTAELHAPVRICARAVVEAGASIGCGSVLMAGAVVQRGARVGADTVLHPGVVLYPGVVVGDRVIVHANAVIGADGFGFARDQKEYVKIPHIGSVVIGDDVEIGAGTTIDRGTLGMTRIGRGTKIDNLVHIGHNCDFGQNVVVAACSAFSGSTHIGDNVMLGGQTVSSGHLKVAADVNIGGATVLLNDVSVPGDYMGYPLMSKVRWFRTLRALARLVDWQRSTPRGDRERDD